MVFYEATPNPNSMKFNLGKVCAEETIFFESVAQAVRSPLAKKIFGFPWAKSIYLGSDFVTITKEDWVEWSVLADPLADLIKEHIEDNLPVLLPLEANAESGDAFDPNDSEDVRLIKTILNTEIRPAVAMDGGDIIFHKYEDQILFLQMQGSCSGCPSSLMTLKSGIETRLKDAIPNLREVVSV